MMWLAWRQHRVSILAGFAVIAVVVVVLLVSGAGMRDEFVRLGLDQCSVPTDLSCTELTRTFTDKFLGFQMLVPFVLLAPALVGVFWGAPLVAREVEQGTHRMVWMQSVSRRRWLLTKVAVLAGASAVAIGVLTAAVVWWMQPLMDARPRGFEPGLFDVRGIVPVAYGIAALLLGVAAGAFSRKLVPAIALTLLLFTVLRVGVEVGVRPHLMEPVSATYALPVFGLAREGDTPIPTEWVLVLETKTADGRVVSDGVGIDLDLVDDVCPEAAAEPEPPIAGGPVHAPDDPTSPMAECARRLGFHVEAVYQPPERFWRFQLTEAGLFLALSAALLGASLWWIRHRVS